MDTSFSICTFILVKQLIFFFAHQRAAAAPLTMYLTYGSEQVLSYFFFLVAVSVCSVCLLCWYKTTCFTGTKLLQSYRKATTKVLQKSYKSPEMGVRVTERFLFCPAQKNWYYKSPKKSYKIQKY